MLLCDNYLNCVISSGFKTLADLVFQFRLQLLVDNSNQSVIPQLPQFNLGQHAKDVLKLYLFDHPMTIHAFPNNSHYCLFQSKSFGIASSYMEKIFSLVLVVRTLAVLIELLKYTLKTTCSGLKNHHHTILLQMLHDFHAFPEDNHNTTTLLQMLHDYSCFP